MWWIIGFVALCTVMVVVISRRGSTGVSRAEDLPSTYRGDPRAKEGGLYGGTGGMDGGSGGF